LKSFAFSLAWIGTLILRLPRPFCAGRIAAEDRAVPTRPGSEGSPLGISEVKGTT